MGLFEKAGKRFEQFKQKAEATAKQDVEYQCSACEKELYSEHDACPECGAEDLERVEPDEEASSDSDDDS